MILFHFSFHFYEDRDLCAMHNPCLHGGICVNAKEVDNKVTCKCRARFTGDRCESKWKTDSTHYKI